MTDIFNISQKETFEITIKFKLYYNETPNIKRRWTSEEDEIIKKYATILTINDGRYLFNRS